MIEVRGVHPVKADEPVFLIDVGISGNFVDVDWEAITQADPSQSSNNWQVAYDEQELNPLPDGRARAAFFFHYLDLNKPLQTSVGQVDLPENSPLPADLAHIRYEAP